MIVALAFAGTVWLILFAFMVAAAASGTEPREDRRNRAILVAVFHLMLCALAFQVGRLFG